MEWENYPSKYTMSWNKAKKEEVESSWRLPTKDEILEAYSNKVEGFIKGNYWTSEFKEGDIYNAWSFDFEYGRFYYVHREYSCYVRLIK